MSVSAIDGTGIPEYVSQGLPFDSGQLAVDTASAIHHYHQGLPFTANSRIAASQDPPTRFNSGGMPLTATGRLSMDSDAVDHYSAGIPYESDSSIASGGLAPFLGVTITTQPDDQSVTAPNPATFFVAATSGDLSPLTYQWEIFNTPNWEPLIDGAPISGATTDTLVIDPTEVADTGSEYRCAVTNDVETRESNSATLTVGVLQSFLVLSEDGDSLISEDGLDNIVQEAA
jgi:hypothetical protein